MCQKSIPTIPTSAPYAEGVRLVCPAFIDTKDLRIATRGFMVEKGEYPHGMDRLGETLERVHNISGEPNEDRAMWVQALGEVPKDIVSERKGEGGLLRWMCGFLFSDDEEDPSIFCPNSG